MLLRQKEAVIVSGRITSGPDEKISKTGKTVTTLSLRYDYDKEQKTGKFIHISIWGNDGIDCAKIYKNGDSIFVIGRLESYEYNGRTYQSVNADFVAPGAGVIAALLASAGKKEGAV